MGRAVERLLVTRLDFRQIVVVKADLHKKTNGDKRKSISNILMSTVNIIIFTVLI